MNKFINKAKKIKDERYGKKLHCIPKFKYSYHHALYEKMATKEAETVKKDKETVKKRLFKFTHEYDMMMLRESMRKERQYMQKLTSYTGKDSF